MTATAPEAPTAVARRFPHGLYWGVGTQFGLINVDFDTMERIPAARHNAVV